jgi:hypothetical protein
VSKHPFRYEEPDDSHSLMDLIHQEAMEHEVARHWPTLKTADNGSITRPDGYVDEIEGLACLVIDLGDDGIPSTLVLDRDGVIGYARQLEVIGDASELPAEARDESMRIVLVLDHGSVTWFWLSSTDYAPAGGRLN